MNVLFEADTIEGRARALGKRHQKKHLYDDIDRSKSMASHHRFDFKVRGWIVSIKSCMKHLLALAVCAGVVFSRPARASIVADWTFPSSGTPANPINATSTLGTTGSPTLDGSLFPVNHGGEAFTTSGTSDVLQFNYKGNHGASINGQTLSLTLTASTTIVFSGLTYSTSFTGASAGNPLTQTWTYSINGGTSTTLGTVTLTDGNLDNESLSPTMTLSAGQTITFTDTISGASAINGALNFGEFQLISVNTVPEPVTWALIGFGVVVGIGTAARRLSGRI
jgi:hypothetical protein